MWIATNVVSERLTGRFSDFVTDLARDWPLYATAATIFALAVFLYFVFGRLRPFTRIAPNPFIGAILNATLRAAILILGTVMALDLIGATAVLGSILGAAGVLGIAVGFALRDVLENYLAGLLLSLRHPFARNDLVRIEDHLGSVLKLTPRATILLGLDGNHIRLPNALVFKAIIVNYTREPRRRFDFEVGVDVGADLSNVRQIVFSTLHEMDGVIDDPAPICNVERLGDSNVVLFIAGWMDQRQSDFGRVRSEAIRLVKQRLDDALVGMPEPIINVRMFDAAPTLRPDADPGQADRRPETRQNEAEALEPGQDTLSAEDVSGSQTEGDLLDLDAPDE